MTKTTNGKIRVAIWAGWLVLLSMASPWGCGGTEPYELEDDPTVATVVQAVRNAPASTAARWSVGLDFRVAAATPTTGPNILTNCTGSVLTGHWILTAAHCIDGPNPPTTVQVMEVNAAGTYVPLYTGNMTAYPHPDFNPATPGAATVFDSMNDIGLIRLHGAGLSRVRRASLFADGKPPSWISDTFEVSGFGFGNNTGSGTCPTTAGTKRTGVFDHGVVSAPLTTRGVSRNNAQDICRADSGSGWYVTVGTRDLVFGVESTGDDVNGCDCNSPNSGFTGASVEPKINWIIETTDSTAVPITCRAERARDPNGWFNNEYKYRVCQDSTPRQRADRAMGMIGGLVVESGRMDTTATEIAGDWLEGWHLSPTDQIGPVGNFSGGRAEQFVIKSDWGIGVLQRRPDGRLEPIAMARYGWVGSWYLRKANYLIGAGDFDGDGRDELVVRSDRGIALLSLRANGTFRPLTMVRNSSWLGGWYLQGKDRIAAVADFDNDNRDELLVQSSWGIGLLQYGSDRRLRSEFMAQNGSWLGTWHLGSNDRVVATGDFDTDGRTDVVVQSPWGIGLLRTVGSRSWTVIGAAKAGRWLDAWQVSTADEVAGVGDWDGNGRDDLVIHGSRGLHVVTLDPRSGLWPIDTMLNGNFYGHWNLTSRNAVVGVGDFDNDGSAEIAVQSAWGLGMLRSTPYYATTEDAQRYGSMVGAWLLRPSDRVYGVARLDGNHDALLIRHTVHSGLIPLPPWS